MTSKDRGLGLLTLHIFPDLSFAILLELQDDKAPAVSHGKARTTDLHLRNVPDSSSLQEPPPWIPAARPETTAGVTDAAELHMVRAVDTGIIDVCVIAAGEPTE